jgi:putative signal transducing protein
MADENDDLVQKIEGDGITWIEIASASSEDEANLLCGFLENEGIPAQIENVKFHMEPVNVGKMGEIRVFVQQPDEQRAMDMLRRRNDAFDRLDDDDETLVTDDGATTIDPDAVPSES